MKKRIFYHPLWTHMPALALLGVLFIALWQGRAYQVPMNFTADGMPGRMGPAWLLFLGLIVLSMVFLGVSVLVDELWARQERGKTFNWMAPLDEMAIGMLGGIAMGYLANFQPILGVFTWQNTARNTLREAWYWSIALTLFGLLFAVVLEWLRPYVPSPQTLTNVDTGSVQAEVRERMRGDRHWAYVESQNPRWMSPLIFLISAVMIVAAVQVWAIRPLLSLLYVVIALAVYLLYGGLQVSVTRERVQVRLGMLGLRLLTIPLSTLKEADVYTFSPLRDFGGYGIRFNREMRAYFFRGNRGVRVSTTRGKQYLIGSDTPEKLHAVIGVMMEAQAR